MKLIPDLDDCQRIGKTYRLLFTLIYSYGIIFVGIILSCGALYAMTNADITVSFGMRDDALRLEERKFDTTFRSYLEQGISQESLKMVAKGGPLSVNSGVIESFNNIVSFHGLILPRVVSLKQNLPLKDPAYFNSPSYNLRDLQIYLDNAIYTLSMGVNKVDEKPTLKEIPGSDLVAFYSLSCLFNPGVLPGVCDGFIDEFLNSFWQYSIKEHSKELLSIFDKIFANTAQKDRFCQSMINNVRVSLEADLVFSSIAGRCGPETYSMYELLISLQTVNNEIDGLSIGSRVFSNKALNTYKLLSAQQRIFLDLRNKRFNSLRIDSYLLYVEELLKNDGLEGFYYDIMYLFNNDVLGKKLLGSDIAAVVTDKSLLKSLLNKIEMLNGGNEALGYKGIRQYLVSSALQSLFSDEISIAELSNLPLHVRFLKRFSFPFYSVLDAQTVAGDMISTKGLMQFDELQSENTSFDVEVDFFEKGPSYLVRSFRLLMDNGSGIVESYDAIKQDGIRFGLIRDESVGTGDIVLPILDETITGYDKTLADRFLTVQNQLQRIRGFIELNEIFTIILAKNDLNLNQLYPLILKNLDFFFQPNEDITMCDRFIDKEIIVDTCDDTMITFSQSFFGSGYNYTIDHDKGVVLSYSVDNEALQAKIYSEIGIPRTNETSIASFVTQLMEISPEIPKDPSIFDNDETPADARILIVSLGEKYLGAKPEAVLTKDGKTLVAVTINDISFVFDYDMLTNTILRGYMQDLGARFVMENIDLSLNDESQGRLRVFANDPLMYLQRDFPGIVSLYKQKTGILKKK